MAVGTDQSAATAEGLHDAVTVPRVRYSARCP
jgi:hypothetical protein